MKAITDLLPNFVHNTIYWKYLNSLETLIRQKRKLLQWELNPTPLIYWTSALDHRGFPICPRSLIQVIHVWSLNCDYQLFTRCHLCIPSAQCFTTVHLFHASVWMVYHHLNNFNSQVFLFQWKYINSLETLIRQKRKLLWWELNLMPLVCWTSALDC